MTYMCYVVSVFYSIIENVDFCLNRIHPVGGKGVVDSRSWLRCCPWAIHQHIVVYSTRYYMPGSHMPDGQIEVIEYLEQLVARYPSLKGYAINSMETQLHIVS